MMTTFKLTMINLEIHLKSEAQHLTGLLTMIGFQKMVFLIGKTSIIDYNTSIIQTLLSSFFAIYIHVFILYLNNALVQRL